MEVRPEFITSAVAVAALILGIYLRPLIEEWFSNRHRTLEVTASDDVIEMFIPNDKINVDWDGAPTDRIIRADFRLENRTGRTLRGFELEIGPSNPPQHDERFETHIQAADRARFIKRNEASCQVYKFDFIEPHVALRGFLLSTYSRRVKFCALGDVELRRRDPFGRAQASAIWSKAAAFAAIASLVVAMATLIWS